MKASKRSFAASRRNRHQRMRLMLEQLEQRTLFAADLDTNLGQFEPISWSILMTPAISSLLSSISSPSPLTME